MDANQGDGSGAGDIFGLINSFNCLGTDNKEDLVRQFVGFIAVDPVIAGFYLEANNWNLQLAINAFMDTQSALITFQVPNPSNPTNNHSVPQNQEQAEAEEEFDPEADEESDEEDDEFEDDDDDEESEIGDDILELTNQLPPQGPITIHPGTKFQIAWQLRNITPEVIPAGTQIVRTSGPVLGTEQACVFPSDIESGGFHEVTIELISPSTPGNFITEWKVLTPNLKLYGPTIVTELNVLGDVAVNGNAMDGNNNVQVGQTAASWMNQNQQPQQSGPGNTGQNQPSASNGAPIYDDNDIDMS